MKNNLLNEDELEWSCIVANNTMNRQRMAFGISHNFKFTGADENAGPNYTKQEVIDSYYFIDSKDEKLD